MPQMSSQLEDVHLSTHKVVFRPVWPLDSQPFSAVVFNFSIPAEHDSQSLDLPRTRVVLPESLPVWRLLRNAHRSPLAGSADNWTSGKGRHCDGVTAHFGLFCLHARTGRRREMP